MIVGPTLCDIVGPTLCDIVGPTVCDIVGSTLWYNGPTLCDMVGPTLCDIVGPTLCDIMGHTLCDILGPTLCDIVGPTLCDIAGHTLWYSGSHSFWYNGSQSLVSEPHTAGNGPYYRLSAVTICIQSVCPSVQMLNNNKTTTTPFCHWHLGAGSLLGDWYSSLCEIRLHYIRKGMRLEPVCICYCYTLLLSTCFGTSEPSSVRI